MNFRNSIFLFSVCLAIAGNAQQLDVYLQQAETTNRKISGEVSASLRPCNG